MDSTITEMLNAMFYIRAIPLIFFAFTAGWFLRTLFERDGEKIDNVIKSLFHRIFSHK